MTDDPWVHPLLAGRWSPRQFDPAHALTRDELASLLEAARWAPSAGNTQPTRWVVTLRGEPAHTRLVRCLKRGNQPWAPRAAALLVAVATTQDGTGRAYPSHLHDAGQATAHLSLQAEALGLRVHQMGGFDGAAVRRELGLSVVQVPAVVIAVGVVGGEPLPDGLAEREAAPRTRLAVAELLLDPEPAQERPGPAQAGPTSR